MSRLPIHAALVGLLCLVGVGPAHADWTVAHRIQLQPTGQVVDLEGYLDSDEEWARVVLTGTFSFLHDGSEIDAMSQTVGGRRDVSGAPYVILPPGTRVIEEEPELHRYTVEIPHAPTMPIRFNAMGLATRNLLTLSEASMQLTGVIEVAHLVPPPPPPTETEVAVASVTETASSVPTGAIVAGVGGLMALGLFGFVFARRRKEHVATLLRRAAQARTAIGREVVQIGPAFDPVAASADRLLESARQQAAHYRSLGDALERTKAMEAAGRRAELVEKRSGVLSKLEGVVGRLEETATHLAGRAADETQARGVDRILKDLGDDLDAAVEAQEEVARV